MGVLVLIDDASVLELDVEVLINRVQSPSDGQIVLELNRDFSPNQILEVREEQLHTYKPFQCHTSQTAKKIIIITQSKDNKKKTKEKQLALPF